MQILRQGAKTSSKSMPCSCFLIMMFICGFKVSYVEVNPLCLYAFDPCSVPRYTILLLRSSSFVRCCDGTFAYAMQPKIIRLSKFGFLFLIASYGVMSCSAFVGTLFRIDVKFKEDETWDWKDYMNDHAVNEPEWTDFNIGNLEATNKHWLALDDDGDDVIGKHSLDSRDDTIDAENGKERVKHFGITLEDEGIGKHKPFAHHREDELKIKCYKCQSAGHFDFECSSLKNQDPFATYNGASTSRPIKEEDTQSTSSGDFTIIT
nr:ribonuclease H-like domain, reverse transcriptase, RNA-dependent DNA polymerase [Tanacetum cinerariifolium]